VSWLSWLMPSLIVWMLNGVVMAAVLAKLFVFGEPVTKPLTASSVSYWRSRRQADVYLAAVYTSYILILVPTFSSAEHIYFLVSFLYM